MTTEVISETVDEQERTPKETCRCRLGEPRPHGPAPAIGRRARRAPSRSASPHPSARSPRPPSPPSSSLTSRDLHDLRWPTRWSPSGSRGSPSVSPSASEERLSDASSSQSSGSSDDLATGNPRRRGSSERTAQRAPAFFRTAVCDTCGVRIAGTTYRFNDHSYCCERHRLDAVQKSVAASAPEEKAADESSPKPDSKPATECTEHVVVDSDRRYVTWT